MVTYRTLCLLLFNVDSDHHCFIYYPVSTGSDTGCLAAGWTSNRTLLGSGATPPALVTCRQTAQDRLLQFMCCVVLSTSMNWAVYAVLQILTFHKAVNVILQGLWSRGVSWSGLRGSSDFSSISKLTSVLYQNYKYEHTLKMKTECLDDSGWPRDRG